MIFQFGLLAHKPQKWQKNNKKFAKKIIDSILLLKYLKSTDRKQLPIIFSSVQIKTEEASTQKVGSSLLCPEIVSILLIFRSQN